MDELKLYMVYYLGDSPCWNLRVARSEEEAIMQCFNTSKKPKPPGAAECSCRAEEVRIAGYKIKVEKI
ncbi:MAG: hypothetical protein ACUVTG_05445 [Candidatus Oleimicrobiaceae bacterium]